MESTFSELYSARWRSLSRPARPTPSMRRPTPVKFREKAIRSSPKSHLRCIEITRTLRETVWELQHLKSSLVSTGLPSRFHCPEFRGLYANSVADAIELLQKDLARRSARGSGVLEFWRKE